MMTIDSNFRALAQRIPPYLDQLIYVKSENPTQLKDNKK